jgi:prevent-host-death family protein
MFSMTDSWTVSQAKAKLSEIMEKAVREGPQTVTRHGRKVAVIVSPEAWDDKSKRKGTLGDFLANSPLKGSGLELQLPDRKRGSIAQRRK